MQFWNQPGPETGEPLGMALAMLCVGSLVHVITVTVAMPLMKQDEIVK